MNPSRTDRSSNQSAEPIRPLAVARRRRTDRQRSIPWEFLLGSLFCAILIAVIVGGLWLYRDLSRSDDRAETPGDTVDHPPPPSGTVRPPETGSTPPPRAADEATATKTLAQERRNRFAAAKADLEQSGAEQWAGEGYKAVTDLGERAEGLWSEKRYGMAAETYSDALAEADRLKERKKAILQQRLVAAQQALEIGDAAEARDLFSMVIVMDPDNPAAVKGLEQAHNFERAQELTVSGRAFEQKGDLAASKAAYEKALALNPDAEAAAEGIARVDRLSKEARFKALMSEALSAINRRDFAAGRSKLIQADRLQPDAAAVKDAMARLEQSARVEEIKRLRKSALAAEAKENWEQALAFYLMVLELDPDIEFAKDGRIDAQDRIRITKRVRFYVANPDALTSDPQLQNAMALIDEAQQLSPRGPTLAALLEQLRSNVTAAATPVKVVLTSDGQTQVAVYKIGRLGRFERHVLDLRPGTYTVVGSRDGFQDVRKQIVVKPGQEAPHFTIICNVKI